MKKVGFIDYYLNEGHANYYPARIKRISGGKYEVAYCYGKIDSPKGKTNKEWSELNGIELLATEEEVIEKSDVIIVLSPDNAEMHEELCQKALASGKRVFVDKTFAPDKATAKRIFEIAEKSGTPCYSSSALRYAKEYRALEKEGIKSIYSDGPGGLETYSIHQIEPIAYIMGTAVKNVTFNGDNEHPKFTMEFEGDRFAEINLKSPIGTFRMNIRYMDGTTKDVEVDVDYWDYYTEEMIDFFETGEIKVSHEETLAIMGIREAVVKAYQTPNVKVPVS